MSAIFFCEKKQLTTGSASWWSKKGYGLGRILALQTTVGENRLSRERRVPVERLGFIGIIIEDRSSAKAVNDILSSFGDIIRGRMGVPGHQTGDAVIGVVVKGTNEQLGAMTGRLGNLKGVQVKSALASPKNTQV